MLTKFVFLLGLACMAVQGTVTPGVMVRNVCADCNDQMRDFTSLEAMNEFNTHHDAYCYFQHNGSCSKVIPFFCTREYEPRCAWNGRKFKNFSNDCELRKFNYQFYDRYFAVSNCLCHPDANRHML